MSITELFNSPTFKALLATLEPVHHAPLKIDPPAVPAVAADPNDILIAEICNSLDRLDTGAFLSRRQELAIDATGFVSA